MSENVNMSLSDSISKRKTTEPRGDREGFRGRRGGRGFRGGRGGRRGDSARPFRGGDRKPFSKFGRGGFKRDGDRERPDKFKADRQSRRPISKLGLKGKFIRRTGPRGARDEPRPDQTERRVEHRIERERPLTEKRRLRVSNLDFNITHKDLMELFSKLGSLTKNKIEYDDLGRSKGTALIEYEKHDSAVKAMQEYDGAVLDGRTITVEFDDDAKKRSGDSGVLRKTITKDFGFERRRERRDDRREDRRDDWRENRERGGRRFNDDRGFRKPFRRDGFRKRGGFRRD